MTISRSKRSWQHTKVICTLGPATDPPGVLEELVLNGMDVARLNMSHGVHDDHATRIARVRDVSQALSRPLAILADLPGPKFRIGALEGGSRALHDGMTVFLTRDASGADCLPVRQHDLLKALRAGESVYLADGSIELRVKTASDEHVACEVAVGGTVRAGSGINVPDSELPALVPTDEDRQHIAFASARGVDWIGVSFVQSAQDLVRVRACVPDTRMLLMAKIEKRRALANLEAIIDAADGVMVARGDLGVETDLAEIPLVQKRIIASANAMGRPVVTATQMLESMVEHVHPTRAEVTDVANAVLDGTDAVMLSAESAVGRHPVSAVRILQRVLAATEAEYAARIAAARLQAADNVEPEQAVAFAACELAQRLGAKAIIMLVSNHAMPSAMARFRPAAPVIALTTSDALCCSLMMLRGVSPLRAREGDDGQGHISRARDWLLEVALARPGDRAVAVSQSDDAAGAPDTLQVVALGT